MLDYNNLEQIDSLKKARIKNDENQNLLHKRVKQARRDLVSLRKMRERMTNPSAIDYLTSLITEIESHIGG